jgi:hypothetical protein
LKRVIAAEVCRSCSSGLLVVRVFAKSDKKNKFFPEQSLTLPIKNGRKIIVKYKGLWVDRKAGGKMLRRIDKKRSVKPRPAPCNTLNCHRWESKMEIIRLISGKPELKLKTISEPAS